MAEENIIDLQNFEIKVAIEKTAETSVAGLKTKNTEPLSKLKDASGKLAQFKSQFQGVDIEAVNGLLSKAGQDEDTKLLTEG